MYGSPVGEIKLKKKLFVCGLLLCAVGVISIVYSNIRSKRLTDEKTEYPLSARMPLPPNSECPTCAVFPEIRSVGSIVVDWPKSIAPNTSKSVVVRLRMSHEKLELGEMFSHPDRQDYLSNIKSDIPLAAPRVISEDRFFRSGDHWAAYLSATTFDVSPNSPELQPFELDNAEWRWNISPKQSADGKQIINIAVHAQYTLDELLKDDVKKDESQKKAPSVKNTKTYIYPLYLEELPIEINLGWVNWTFVKLGGLITILTGVGITFPFFREWLKERRARQKPARAIGFRP
jgi:hypothetical protein